MFSPIPLFRPFLQLVAVSLAVFCAESRVSDYKHHPGDVVAGSLLGIIIVIVTVRSFKNCFQITHVLDEKCLAQEVP